MSTVTAKRRCTPQQLLRLSDCDRYELVDGELVERNMGWESSWIGGRLHFFLSAYCHTGRWGWVAPADASYQCFPDSPEKVRRPDVSCIRLERLSADQVPEGHCPIAPDLAAEVVSPNDLYADVEEKVMEYLAAGVSLIWVVNPRTRTVRVHRADGTVSDLGDADELSGESILPGFSCRIADLFVAPPAAAAKP